MSDHTEIWTALRTAMTGDATLVAMLDSADQIWRQAPDGPIRYPAIVLEVPDDRPQTQISGTGVWRPNFEIHVYAETFDICRQIIGRLDEQFTIPENRQQISSANFRMTLLRRRNGNEAGTVRDVDSGKKIRHFASEWQCRINKQ